MALREGVEPVRVEDAPMLVEVWEASVRATHHFLTEADIQFFKPLVRDSLRDAADLSCVRTEDGVVVAFLDVEADAIEALFVHPEWRGAGIGRRLVNHAVNALGARSVVVNEQNDQAVGFYLRMGFQVYDRSEIDRLGKPFPLLHMRLASQLRRRSR
jgi:putative acetyltransferase